ncbi:MAG TPA: 16S rRNA processing protein RimM [Peptococcaceae bacterium]|nr:16S rRNA processing protein RimM [Peptococcaceae bacterium]
METVVVGEILKPQGIKGEIKVYPLTDNPTRFQKLQKVFLTQGKSTVCYEVESARIDPKGMVYLKLKGLDTPEDAEKYRGFQVRVDRSEVPPLKDRWYYFELEGMKVYENDAFLGTLLRVQETGANDIYIVQGEKGQFCIPALKSVVKKVDVEAKRMDVILPPGLLDD